MIKTLFTRFKQGFHTKDLPAKKEALPERYLGRPEIGQCRNCGTCGDCAGVCPSDAIKIKDKKISIDMGRCIFCGACRKACVENNITFSRDYSISAAKRESLVIEEMSLFKPAEVNKEINRVFGRSLKLRQVSAGGCNACELDTNVLNTLVFDLGRYGIQFVASPRHADGLLVTGPVTRNMKLALQKTYEAMPSPKIVIATGACAVSGGLYAGHEEVLSGVDSMFPVDLYIPGCPPHPLTILDGLLSLIRRKTL